MASTYLAQSLKNIIQRIDLNKERTRPVEMLEMYKLYQKLLKVSKQTTFALLNF